MKYAEYKAKKVFGEFGKKQLHSGSGKIVTDPKQATAIYMSYVKKHKGA